MQRCSDGDSVYLPAPLVHHFAAESPCHAHVEHPRAFEPALAGGVLGDSPAVRQTPFTGGTRINQVAGSGQGRSEPGVDAVEHLKWHTFPRKVTGPWEHDFH
jgi:hypothetical protein